MEFNRLSKDLKCFIFLGFEMLDIYNLYQVSKHFNNLLNECFWMNKVLNDFGKHGHIPKNINKKYDKNPDWKCYYKIIYNLFCDKEYNKKIRVHVMFNDLEIIKVILNDSRLDPYFDNNILIQESCYYGHEKLLLLLNDHRANPSFNINYSIRFASANGHLEILKILLSDKRVNSSIKYNSVIEISRTNGHTEIVKFLKSKSLILK